MLSELVTPGVLQPTPLKKNLVLRFETRTRRGKRDYIRRSGIIRQITRLRILNHTGSWGYMVKSNLVQLRSNLEVEIDEDNGETTRR